MKFAVLTLLATLATAQAQISNAASSPPRAAGTPTAATPAKARITPATFHKLEGDFDTAYFGIGTAADPADILGATRGIYLDGYGAVFTTEFSPVPTPAITPFKPQIPKEEVADVHKRKLARMPALRQKMQGLMRTAAQALTQLPENEQIVIVVRLDYARWEDTTGLPSQILIRSGRKSALAGQIDVTEEQ